MYSKSSFKNIGLKCLSNRGVETTYPDAEDNKRNRKTQPKYQYRRHLQYRQISGTYSCGLLLQTDKTLARSNVTRENAHLM